MEFAGLPREIGVQRRTGGAAAAQGLPDRAAAHLQGFRFSPTPAACARPRKKDAACVGEKAIAAFRRMGVATRRRRALEPTTTRAAAAAGPRSPRR